MMKKSAVIFISFLLICATLCNLWGCASVSNEKETEKSVGEFTVKLFQENCTAGKNTVLSPLSLLYALSIAQNGSAGVTSEEMEEAIGISKERLTSYLTTYMDNLLQEDNPVLRINNSLWLSKNNVLFLKDDFIQEMESHYRADINTVDFSGEVCNRINSWVKDKTGGIIDKLIDTVPENAVMYLINTLVFQAQWEAPYSKHQIKEGFFNGADGSSQPAVYMQSTEDLYFEDKDACGFMKYYQDRKYAFVAMLPKEGVALRDYLNSLEGEALLKLMENPQKATVITSIPKFSEEFDRDLADSLKQLGIKSVFDPEKADFSKLCTCSDGNVYISEIRQKTVLEMGELGTVAGAGTSAQISYSGVPDMDNAKTVQLNRPFLYIIIDCERNIPLFIGTVENI